MVSVSVKSGLDGNEGFTIPVCLCISPDIPQVDGYQGNQNETSRYVFTICLCISPDIDGYQRTKNERLSPERPTNHRPSGYGAQKKTSFGNFESKNQKRGLGEFRSCLLSGQFGRSSGPWLLDHSGKERAGGKTKNGVESWKRILIAQLEEGYLCVSTSKDVCLCAGADCSISSPLVECRASTVGVHTLTLLQLSLSAGHRPRSVDR
jgi:hypothetical protein